MVGRCVTPEADFTITHHLPPPEDDSTQDISMSFAIPPQADASNLLDQNYDDFLAGPGFVTLSTPVLPRHLVTTAQFVRKANETIQTPAALSGPNPRQTLAADSTTGLLELGDRRTELQETHILPHSLPLLSPTIPSPSTDLSKTSPTVDATLIADPGPPRPAETASKSNPDPKICDALMSDAAPLLASIITTEASGTRPTIQSLSKLNPSRPSSNPQNTQIPNQPPITVTQKKSRVPIQPRGNTGTKSTQRTSRSRSGDGPNGETATRTQTHDRGGATKRPNSTLSNHGFGRVNGRFGSNLGCSNPRGNVTSHALHAGAEHPDPNSHDTPAEGNEGVTQSLVTRVLPPPASPRSNINLDRAGADTSDPSPPLGPPQTAHEHPKAKVHLESAEEEGKEDDRLTVPQLSPSKTARGCRDHYERLDWMEGNSGPTPGTSLAVSPMRPSKKRASSAGQGSDGEPEGALPDEWEKQCLITQSNREGEVRGREAGGEKPLSLLQPLSKKNRKASDSLALTRRLRARAVLGSPRVRKLRDKSTGRARVGKGAGRKSMNGGAPKVSRSGHIKLDACGFPGNVGASTTPNVATPQGEGTDLATLDETTGPPMPYSGDNQDGAIKRPAAGGVVGGPSFRSTLKRSTVPVEFRFELTARLGTTRGSSGLKENPGPGASGSSKECGGGKVFGNPRKRPKLGELRTGENGEAGLVERASTSSRLSERRGDHLDQFGSHAGVLKENGGSGSKISSSTTSRNKKKGLIIPEEFKFSTEQRAKEREKFDMAVRVKQGERERQEEEERAARAVEEEREIKEMRKRTVPKANCIPEWYATMPKRKAA